MKMHEKWGMMNEWNYIKIRKLDVDMNVCKYIYNNKIQQSYKSKKQFANCNHISALPTKLETKFSFINKKGQFKITL